MNDYQDEYDRFFPASIQLETPRVLLRLMKPGDVDAYRPLVIDKSIWTWFTKNLSEPGELDKWVDLALEERQTRKRMPFTITDQYNKQICGSTSYGNISFFDRRIEIGWTWLGTGFISTGVNRHAKFALLSYAFDVMKMERVEIKTDFLNERAKAALLKIGMKPEGVLRSHMLMFNNRRRDSAYYSILKNEWPAVQQMHFSDLL